MFFTLLLAGDFIGGNEAEATQPPPPPTYYSLTVSKSGGDSTCEVRIDMPGPSAWTTSSIQDSFLVGTEYAPTHQITCPSAYVFSHWESNDEDLDEWRENRSPDFTLTKNTTATAVFVPAAGTLTVYVDDPTNDDDPHSPTGNVGHTFWKLDGGCVPTALQGYLGIAWGYYPAGATHSTGSSGSKTWQSNPGELVNDSESGSHGDPHDYTDSREYTISHSQLVAALTYTKALADSPGNYQVESSNCTDKAIGAAAAAGVTLPNAHGSCNHTFHSFDGNCPGTLGENLNP